MTEQELDILITEYQTETDRINDIINNVPNADYIIDDIADNNQNSQGKLFDGTQINNGDIFTKDINGDLALIKNTNGVETIADNIKYREKNQATIIASHYSDYNHSTVQTDVLPIGEYLEVKNQAVYRYKAYTDENDETQFYETNNLQAIIDDLTVFKYEDAYSDDRYSNTYIELISNKNIDKNNGLTISNPSVGRYDVVFDEPLANTNYSFFIQLTKLYKYDNPLEYDPSGAKNEEDFKLVKVIDDASISTTGFSFDVKVMDIYNNTNDLINTSFSIKDMKIFIVQNIKGVEDTDYLIMNFDTYNSTVEIPLYTGEDYNGAIVDWGDGTIEELSSDTDLLHTYAADGNYDVKIYKEVFPGIDVLGLSSYTRWYNLKELKQWGTLKYTNVEYMFRYAKYCEFTATDIPDLSFIISTKNMFYSAYLFNQNINSWDFSNVIDLSSMFNSALAFNNGGVNLVMDLPNSTNANSMFSNSKLDTISIELKNTNKITDTQYMFKYSDFDGDLIMDTSNITNMYEMFRDTKFNHQITFDTTKVANFRNMFYNNKVFNQPITIDMTGTYSAESMFAGCDAFNSEVNITNITRNTSIAGMFSECKTFNSNVNFIGDVEYQINMTSMFQNAILFNSNININIVGAYKNITASKMFLNAKRFNKPLPQSFIDNIYKSDSMFSSTEDFNQPLDFSNNTVIYGANGMFSNASGFNQPLDFTAATYTYFNMSYMFRDCSSFNSSFDAAINYNGAVNDLFKNASSFNQPITLDFTIADNLDEFVLGTAMSPINYANFLIKLNNETSSTGKTLNSGTLTYDSSAQSAVDDLVNNKGWTINDGGVA